MGNSAEKSIGSQLLELGINHNKIHFNLSTEELLAEALSRKEGVLASNEALVVSTGYCTGRSPKDKFIVKHPESQDKVWWGTVNRDISEENFNKLYAKMVAAMNEKEIFVADLFAGADKEHQLSLRVI